MKVHLTIKTVRIQLILTPRREYFSRQGRSFLRRTKFDPHGETTMSANNTSNANNNGKSKDYFNLTINGLGYLSNVRQVNAQSGTFISCVINALSGPSDSPSYVRFDVTVAGKEASSLINRCQKAVDEDKKVLIGFVLSNPSTDIFQLKNGEHAGESRVSLKARLIKVDWVKIGQDMVFKTERAEPQQAPNAASQQQSYAENSF
jgi:hypothetical protein